MSTKGKAVPQVLCNHCRTALSHPNRNAEKSPSGMTKHLKGCNIYQKSGRLNDSESTSSSTSSSNGQSVVELLNPKESDPNQVMSRDRLKERVLRIIVSGNLPFSFADNADLRTLLKDAYPDCPLPNRKSTHEYLQSRSDAALRDIKAKLAANESKVNLVLDAWTSRSNLSFLGTSLFIVTGYCCLLLLSLCSRYIPLHYVTGFYLLRLLLTLFPLHHIADQHR